MDERLNVAANHWAIKRTSDGSRWWHHPAIHRHINRLVCGADVEGPHQGFHARIARMAPAGGFPRALSVGCGSGGKEIALIKAGIVRSFDLFEIGEFRRDQIKAKAEQHNVLDRVTIHIGDALQSNPGANFDLLYWNNSLHHMFDADQAVSWSYHALRDGGCFAMDDFIGPSRFQWPDGDLETASRVRAILPDRFHRHPRNPAKPLDRHVSRPTIEDMMQADPTEAADSAHIMSAILSTFPDAEIIPTGGVVYHLALNDVLANFEEEQDAALLGSLLLLDETLARSGRTHYAVALARKRTSQGQMPAAAHQASMPT